MPAEIERFVNWVRRRSPGAHTWRDYCCDLAFFVQVVGDRPPNEITFHDVDNFIANQTEKGFKPTTINRRLATLLAFYTFLSDGDPNLVSSVLPHRGSCETSRTPRSATRPSP